MKRTDYLKYEGKLSSKYQYIAGIDEVGRGPLVGPVVAAAIILPPFFYDERIKDSKKLTPKKREELDKFIREKALAFGIGVIDNKRIDEVNILNATKEAMKEALSKLKIKPDLVLVDALNLNLPFPEIDIIKGDDKSISIASASIIAKVYRDNIMRELDKLHPEYDFKHNMGYPTKKHLEAIKKYGIIEEHRLSYGPVRDVKNSRSISRN